MNNNDLPHAAKAALPPATCSACLGGSLALADLIDDAAEVVSEHRYYRADAFGTSIERNRRELESLDKLRANLWRIRDVLKAAPVALMDTRAALSVCALKEEDFPALYALQGHRVVLVDLGPNA
jgi:hypothetical protein